MIVGKRMFVKRACKIKSVRPIECMKVSVGGREIDLEFVG